MKKLLCQVGTVFSALAMLMVMGALFEGTIRAMVAVPVLVLLCTVAWVLCQLPYVHIRWEPAGKRRSFASKQRYQQTGVSRTIKAGHAA